MSMYGIDPEETAEVLERDPGHQTAADLIRQLAARITELEARTDQTGASGTTARLLNCGLCYEENGEEVHPHPECIVRNATPGALERGRGQLLEAMSAVSEDRTCCGWAPDWARTLHAEGGIWETLGRAVGWPTGNYDQWEWASWDEATALYATTEAGL